MLWAAPPQPTACYIHTTLPTLHMTPKTTRTLKTTCPATASAPAVHCRVDVLNANAHLFRVTLTVATPASEQRVSLPVWIPGSYLVREFAKNLQNLTARQGARGAVPVQQLDK